MEKDMIADILGYLDDNFQEDLGEVQKFMRLKSISATGGRDPGNSRSRKRHDYPGRRNV
ncbi:MAG: hypothetical protein ACLTOJ_21635 [[Clostridium] symbiosum]